MQFLIHTVDMNRFILVRYSVISSHFSDEILDIHDAHMSRPRSYVVFVLQADQDCEALPEFGIPDGGQRSH